MNSGLSQCHKYLRNKLERFRSESYEKEKSDIRSLMYETVQFGKSNFVLVISERFVGNAVIDDVLNELASPKSDQRQFQIIKLDGCFHGNDDLAFKSIVRQLNCEESFDGDLIGSAADFLGFVVNSLQQANGTSRPLIFVLDNFDAFCEHEKQLLYNLLDITNHQSAPIFAIGLTESICCFEKLRERTQSRSSNVVAIYLHSDTDLQNRLQYFHSLLTIESGVPATVKNKWNQNVEELCTDRRIKNILKEILDNSLSEELFINFMRRSINYLSESCPTLNKEMFEQSYAKIFNADTSAEFKMKTLTTLELCLVISIYHHCENMNSNLFNFELIYDKYRKVALKASNLPRVDRELASKAFQTLRRFGIITLKENNELESTPLQYLTHELLFSRNSICEIVKKKIPNLPIELVKWVDDCLFLQ